jgi:hypothetical protein
MEEEILITKKYNYVYKIQSKLDDTYYYGVHATDKLEDGYMGSGTKLHEDYELIGKEN